METNAAKQELRIAMKSRRREVPPDVRISYSSALCRRIWEREDVRRAVAAKGVFAAYLASPEEIDLVDLIRRFWAAGCRVAVPAWRGGTYRLVEYPPGTKLAAGPMGIPEPDAEDGGNAFADESEISVWIVPGLAFSRSGARLGYGGGWYDRFLSGAADSSVSLGVAYPFQIVGNLPLEPHDLPLADVVSIQPPDGAQPSPTAPWPSGMFSPSSAKAGSAAS